MALREKLNRLGRLGLTVLNELRLPKDTGDTRQPVRLLLRKLIHTAIFGLGLTSLILWRYYDWTTPSNFSGYSFIRDFDADETRISWRLMYDVDPLSVLPSCWSVVIRKRIPCEVKLLRRSYEWESFGASSEAEDYDLEGNSMCGRSEEHNFDFATQTSVPIVKPQLAGTKPLNIWITFPGWLPPVVFFSISLIVFYRGPLRRARRRLTNCCIVCGYSLEKLTEPRCPECGEPASTIPLAHPPVSS